jgi:hypothetical protein
MSCGGDWPTRNVPDALHRLLKAHAALAGLSLLDGLLDVRFISSLPVMQQPAYKVWADKRPVQIVWAVR